jgi:hypothetical protein
MTVPQAGIIFVAPNASPAARIRRVQQRGEIDTTSIKRQNQERQRIGPKVRISKRRIVYPHDVTFVESPDISPSWRLKRARGDRDNQISPNLLALVRID